MDSNTPCDNFGELALRIHDDKYYAHPLYIDLHEKADDIINIYIEWKETKEKRLAEEIQLKIAVWVDIFDSVKSNKTKKKIKITDVCAICQDEIEPGDSVRSCSSKKNAHVFHERCALNFTIYEKEQGYDRSLKCPTCRDDFDYQYSTEIRAI